MKKPSQKMFYLFEISDFLIFNKIPSDKFIFHIIQKSLISSNLFPEFSFNFPSLREKFPSLENSINSLWDIYSEIALSFSLNKEDISFLVNLEEKIINENLVLCLENINFARDKQKEGFEAIFIVPSFFPIIFFSSNLPLFLRDSIFIPQKLLEETENLEEILSSFDLQKSQIKNSYIFSTSFKNFSIFHNQKQNLYELPFNPSLNDYERDILSKPYYHKESFFIQKLCGTSKSIRIQNNLPKENLGGSFVAPLFVPFVHFVIKDSLKKGIKKLFFCARDAFIFKEIAEKFIKSLSLDIKISYLYISRNSSWGTSFPLPLRTPDSLIQIYKRMPYEDVNKFFKLTGINKIDNFSFPDNLKKTEDILKYVFLHFEKSINEVLLLRRNSLISYLEQENFFSDNTAIVDIGWMGRIQDELFYLGVQKSKETLIGYYMFLEEGFKENLNSHNIKIPLVNLSRKEMSIRVATVTEAFLNAPHGGTLRYEKRNDKFFPLLKEEKNPFIEWGSENYWKAILEFTETYLEDYLLFDSLIEFSYPLFVKNIISYHYKKPNISLAKEAGSIPYTHEILHSKIKQLAPPYKIQGMLKAKKNKEIYSYWEEASFHQSSKPIKVLLRFYRRVKDYSRFFIRIPKRIKSKFFPK